MLFNALGFALYNQYGFQTAASPFMEGIIDLHHNLFFFMILVFIFVFWTILNCISYFTTSEKLVLFNKGHFLKKNVFSGIVSGISNYTLQSTLVSDILIKFFKIKNAYLAKKIKKYFNFESDAASWAKFKNRSLYLRFNHGTLIELIWTIAPCLILGVIAVQSFNLLYSAEDVTNAYICVKVIGHQWYWTYEYTYTFEEGSNSDVSSISSINSTGLSEDQNIALLMLIHDGFFNYVPKDGYLIEEHSTMEDLRPIIEAEWNITPFIESYIERAAELMCLDAYMFTMGHTLQTDEMFKINIIFGTDLDDLFFINNFKYIYFVADHNPTICLNKVGGPYLDDDVKAMLDICCGGESFNYTQKALSFDDFKASALADLINKDLNTFDTNYVIKHVSITSYMVPTDELNNGDLRLLECDKALFVPAYVHVNFYVTAADVLHSWTIPSLGIKMDAIPGRLNMVSTYIARTGVYYGQCSEICGINHGFMPIVLIAYQA